jgi:CxxC motif-containing protein
MRDPERVLTSTVKVEGGEWPLVSVRSLAGVRKDELRTLIALLDGITLSAPVRLGDIVLKGAGRNKVDIIATRSVAMRRNITL